MNSQLVTVSRLDKVYSYLKSLNNKRKREIFYFKGFMELQRIIKNNSLATYFQPILNLESGDTLGYEALNRPVSKFFCNTESFYDFVGQTDQVFLFECFCRNVSMKRFIDRYKDEKLKRNSLLFINIHPHVLLDTNYHSGETLQLLCDLGIEPNQIVFELTEKSAVTDFGQFEKVLSNYRSQGFRIAIDDVGSGYNSLKTLVYLKPEFIKLDKSIIQHIDRNSEQQKLVTLLIEYANQSDTKIIAEGIERLEELSYIREKGVHYGQGYALGRPKENLVPGYVPL
ncbi:EAL domain-containing protein [Bacillus sp. Marseille-P3661]|uniref:EAL domain-containing protein n=1 Tax=Bacillus sp. Marseille-P3661 TaxID=1936234 RepID=UPI0021556043|nr:EAL domain-containing protein [Bacillus sp. Marseille-P3661]